MSLQRSHTAEVVTLARAAGSIESDPAVRNNDYLSREFLNRTFSIALRMPRITKLLYQLLVPGVYLYLHMRTRHIDSILEAELKKGIDQFLIVGSGLDSRAYRYRGTLKKARVFELDHPSTAAIKQQRLKRWGKDTSHVTYVGIDLAEEPLGRKLTEAGFDFAARSFILIEGVLYYLPEKTVTTILEGISRVANGSTLVFDYVIKAAIENRIDAYGARKIARYCEKKKEPILSSIDPDMVANMLRPYGFGVVSNDVSAVLAQYYLRQSNGKLLGRVCEIYGIVHARHD